MCRLRKYPQALEVYLWWALDSETFQLRFCFQSELVLFVDRSSVGNENTYSRCQMRREAKRRWNVASEAAQRVSQMLL